MFRVWTLLFSTGLLASCASIPTPPVHVKIFAAKQLNHSTTHESLPVRIKLYQLTDMTSFNEATFTELWKSDMTVLGRHLLEKKELTLKPDEMVTFKIRRQPEAEYFAVVGIFRQHHSQTWKAAKKLPNQLNSLFIPIQVTVKGHAVEIK